MKEESFICEGKGKFKVIIEGEEIFEIMMNGLFKSVEEVVEMLGVEVKDGKIDIVVDGVKVRMQKGKFEFEFESGEKMKIERV